MVKLVSVLSRFEPVNVLVIGDLIFDTYTRGAVKRISPEAPVPVLHVKKEERLPGGAGNVALNLLSLGARVALISRIGEDYAGEVLKEILFKEGVDITGIALQKDYQTPVKNRLIADSQQLIRVDFEDNHEPPPHEILSQIRTATLNHLDRVDIVAISDYGKGLLTKELLQEIIWACRNKNIPVIVDPKGDDFTKYAGSTLIKPNLSEAYAASKLSKGVALEEVAHAILEKTGVDMLLITRSEHGMSLFYPGKERIDFPVRSKEVIDVTGAGDSVLAMISMALANKLSISDAAQLANISAGIAIEYSGCARVQLADIASRLLEFHAENKVFDEEHLFALKQVLLQKKVALLAVDSRHGITSDLLRALRKIADKSEDKKLIVYLRNENPEEEFIEHLSYLSDVDYIILPGENMQSLCSHFAPAEVYSLEKQGLITFTYPEEFLSHLQRSLELV